MGVWAGLDRRGLLPAAVMAAAGNPPISTSCDRKHAGVSKCQSNICGCVVTMFDQPLLDPPYPVMRRPLQSSGCDLGASVFDRWVKMGEVVPDSRDAKQYLDETLSMMALNTSKQISNLGLKQNRHPYEYVVLIVLSDLQMNIHMVVCKGEKLSVAQGSDAGRTCSWWWRPPRTWGSCCGWWCGSRTPATAMLA